MDGKDGALIESLRWTRYLQVLYTVHESTCSPACFHLDMPDQPADQVPIYGVNAKW